MQDIRVVLSYTTKRQVGISFLVVNLNLRLEREPKLDPHRTRAPPSPPSQKHPSQTAQTITIPHSLRCLYPHAPHRHRRPCASVPASQTHSADTHSLRAATAKCHLIFFPRPRGEERRERERSAPSNPPTAKGFPTPQFLLAILPSVRNPYPLRVCQPWVWSRVSYLSLHLDEREGKSVKQEIDRPGKIGTISQRSGIVSWHGSIPLIPASPAPQ